MEDVTSAPSAPEQETRAPAPEAKVEAPKTEAKAPDAPLGDEPATEQQKAEAAHDEALRKAYRESKRERGADGKFAPRDDKPAPDIDAKAAKDSAAKADAKDQKPDEGAEEPAATEKPAAKAIKAPNSWSPDMKAKFETLPPDVREFVAKRESEAHQAISRLGQYAKETKPLIDVLERHRGVFEANNLTYDQGVERLLAVQNLLDRDPRAAIQQIAKAYRVDLAEFGAPSDGMDLPPDPHVERMQQHIAYLEEQLQQVTGHITSQQQAAEQQRHASYLGLVDQFAQTAPDFDDVAAEVVANIQALQAANPNRHPQELLKEAYDRAIWANPKTRAKMQERATKEAEAARMKAAQEAAEKAKAAGRINVSGQRQPLGEMSEDDLLRQAYRKTRARG